MDNTQRSIRMVAGVEYEKSMSGSEIARELGITRQAVSQSLKRAMGKVYQGILDEKICTRPTETIMFMRDLFGVTDEEDIQQFYDLFPSKIQDEVREDARTYTIGE